MVGIKGKSGVYKKSKEHLENISKTLKKKYKGGVKPPFLKNFRKRKCKNCGEYFQPKSYNQKYCGSMTYKKGCSYLMRTYSRITIPEYLELKKKYNKLKKEKDDSFKEYLFKKGTLDSENNYLNYFLGGVFQEKGHIKIRKGKGKRKNTYFLRIELGTDRLTAKNFKENWGGSIGYYDLNNLPKNWEKTKKINECRWSCLTEDSLLFLGSISDFVLKENMKKKIKEK